MSAASAAARKAGDELNAVRQENASQEGASRSKVEKLRQQNRRLDDKGKAVSEYINQRGAHKLQQCAEELLELEQQMKDINAEAATLEKDKQTVDADLQQARATERNLDDNLRYRQFQVRIAELDAEFRKYDLAGISEQRRAFLKDYEGGEKKKSEMDGQVRQSRRPEPEQL